MALPDWVVYSGVITGIGGTLALAFKVRPEARKLKADGAAALTTSAGAIVASMHAEMESLRSDVDEFHSRWRRLDSRLRRHSRWDDHVVAQARAAGITIPDPPKLYDDDED